MQKMSYKGWAWPENPEKYEQFYQREPVHIKNAADVWVFDVYYEETDALTVLKDNIHSSVKQKVKDILERHTYQNNEELSELLTTAALPWYPILTMHGVIR